MTVYTTDRCKRTGGVAVADPGYRGQCRQLVSAQGGPLGASGGLGLGRVKGVDLGSGKPLTDKYVEPYTLIVSILKIEYPHQP